MKNKTRDRIQKRERKNLTPLWVTLCSLLVVAAVVAGFLFAGDIIKNSPGDAAGENRTGQETAGSVNIPVCDSELLYGVDGTSGEIEAIILCRLDSGKNTLRLDFIDPAINYSMSGSLYSELSALSIRIPQAGKFRGLYGYCSGEEAFDAGRRIASEMLAVDIGHYSVFDIGNLVGYFYFPGTDGKKELYAKVTPSSAKGAGFGTPGTVMGFVKTFFGEATSSDRTIDDRLVYLEALDSLGDGDVVTGSVPVTVHNETIELDASGWRRMEK